MGDGAMDDTVQDAVEGSCATPEQTIEARHAFQQVFNAVHKLKPDDRWGSLDSHRRCHSRLPLSVCIDLFHFYGIHMWGTAGVDDAQSSLNVLSQQAEQT
ncbi:MAG: hypothetical protein V1844_03740 [Pseudomonadota bacterium]